MISNSPDRLYELLPVIHRMRDAELGYPLRGLLQVISEQVTVVDGDIAQLYENWFIETCQDWVVPYIGDLVGYTAPSATGEPADPKNQRALTRECMVISRREVANTVRFRRRKGTLAVLEDLAIALVNWPAHAVEFFRLLSYTQNINYLHLDRGRTADIREDTALDAVGSAFEELAHTADVRSINSRHFGERFNLPSVAVFVWQLKTYSVTGAPAYCLEEESPSAYLFSTLGNDTQLFNRPGSSAQHLSQKLNFPTPIARRDLMSRKWLPGKPAPAGISPLYYGIGKSIEIRLGADRQLIPAESLIAADLSGWAYRPLPGQVAIDPERGRILFSQGQPRRQSVWVSYNYAFSADIGGGEYDRPLSEPVDHRLYLVGATESFPHISDALKQWQNDAPKNAVIEITDSGVYVEPVNVSLKPGQTLQLRAANRKRPVIRLLNWQTSLPDSLNVTGETDDTSAKPDCWFTLDGILITGRGIQVQGSVAGVTIRHSTLVPGWGLTCDCEPMRPSEPSLELDDAPDCLRIEHSIVGSIQVQRDEVRDDPCEIYLSDSILDATSPEQVAVGAPGKLCAFAVLDVRRCTVLGQVQAHAARLVENSILMGHAIVCRRQQGCFRFSYVTPGSRTPRRYECQPDLVEAAASTRARKDGLSASEKDNLLTSERLRVEPVFNSVRYGTPDYCQLADVCASEITRGSEDQSEMGTFHDLYQPQRADGLRVRLSEYTPAGMDAGIIFAS
jgi:hypothetical protein